jgi:hypothetical protein
MHRICLITVAGFIRNPGNNEIDKAILLMNSNDSLQSPIIDVGFLAATLTQFSTRLAALELEKQLTVLHPIWKPKCGRADCLWEGEASTDYTTSAEAAYNHTNTMHPGSIPIVVIEKSS